MAIRQGELRSRNARNGNWMLGTCSGIRDFVGGNLAEREWDPTEELRKELYQYGGRATREVVAMNESITHSPVCEKAHHALGP